MHNFNKKVYKNTRNFPRDEIYNLTSQLKRASLSVVLNFIEGYARRKGDNCKVFKNFVEISYGSLKESEYLIYFAYTENYLDKADYDELIESANKIGGMLYGIIKNLK